MYQKRNKEIGHDYLKLVMEYFKILMEYFSKVGPY